MDETSGRRLPPAAATGLAAGLATLAAYLIGAGRGYDYDSGESVGAFIATRSLLDPFRRQLQFNNHPLFSFLEHLVYSAGGTSEAALRVLPGAAGAAAVGLVVWWVGSRWGLVAGLAGGLLLAANPTFAELSRSVRGYSLLTFAAVLSTILLDRLLAGPRRALSVGYSAALAIGLATHLYALFVLLGHVLLVLARARTSRAWLRRWGAALLLGALAYAGMAGRMLGAVEHEQHGFDARFPLRLAEALLGSSPLATATAGALCLVGVVLLGRRVWPAVAGVAAALALDWAVVAPADLYPRFLIWAAPGAAVACAAAVRRSPALLGLAAVAAAAMIAVDARNWLESPLPGRAAAELVSDARALGARACVLPEVRGLLMAYTTPPKEVTSAAALGGCQIALGNSVVDRPLRLAARRMFAHRWLLLARTSLVAYSRFPRPYLERGLTERSARRSEPRRPA